LCMYVHCAHLDLQHFPTRRSSDLPIPDKDGVIIAQDLLKLSECSTGKVFIFTSVTISDDDFLTYLTEKKLELGKEIEILLIERYDRSMTVRIGDEQAILSKIICEKILVKERL